MSREYDDWIISSLLEDLQTLALSRDQISVSDLIETMGSRGFGPLLVVLSAFLILPIGILPGIPGMVSVFMILIGGRMMTGETRLWLPPRLGRVTFSGHILAVSVARAEPAVLWLRPLVAPRWPLMIDSAVMSRVVALILMATAVVILIAGFIPGLPFVLSIHILILGLALSTRDGLLAIVGYGVLFLEIFIIWKVFL